MRFRVASLPASPSLSPSTLDAVGAINFGNGGDSGWYFWDQNNTIRFNNISRVWGAECRDGIHVCQHGRGGFSPAGPVAGAPNHMPGSPSGTFKNDAVSDCGWAT